ncbi:1,4-alpha-glucan-branching enzyme [Trema orientale]|uniref:Aldehyde oxidase GLOX n=1 Tax=Trema orientale TaxID=63057 RepID=A0A2P5F7V0_TREOI|nr:1,4-alpha-glucan-branching enzyme [Trema orientale]
MSFPDQKPNQSTEELSPRMKTSLIPFFPCFLLLFFTGTPAPAEAAGGSWNLLQPSIGISAMHMQLLNNDRVIIFDRTDFGASNLSLPAGKCRNDPNDTALKIDCTAHSAEYDVVSNTFRPLMVQTDVWCSSGAVTPDGTLVQTGGFNDGERRVRIFQPCSSGGCDWREIEFGLNARRWYATNHILPDGQVIVIGGRRQFNYEFYPKTSSLAKNLYSLPFLVQTNDPKVENNLYPFVFLNVDGNLFVFANNRAILLDYVKNRVVKTYPTIPGGDPRCYPSTGSAVLLPLKNLQAKLIEAEVLICGGAPAGSYTQALSRKFLAALKTCARIKITDPNPTWVLEDMPLARVMGDMTLLPTGNVLIVNGGASGTAGWELGRDPVFSPVLYRPDSGVGSRFETQNPSTIPRMYHSTAVLLRDGRVLVGGSNPHVYYNFSGVLFPTELSLEAFSPSYLDSQFANLRPRIVSPGSQTKLSYAQKLVVRFTVSGALAQNLVSLTMVAPSFTTHSFSMNQRLLVLSAEKVTNLGKTTYQVEATAPGSGVLAPSGYYLLFVVHQEIPSEGIWVQIK